MNHTVKKPVLPTEVFPRKKLPNKKNPKAVETENYTLCRRIEEYMEFALGCKAYSDLAFYQELLQFVDDDYTIEYYK
tara:strand:+ start:953 stop:1183 length:231 start_codon:yes stop_codon:yes gene_type:complete